MTTTTTKLLTIEQVALKLKKNVETIRRWTRRESKPLPSRWETGPGSRILIDEADLAAWMTARQRRGGE